MSKFREEYDEMVVLMEDTEDRLEGLQRIIVKEQSKGMNTERLEEFYDTRMAKLEELKIKIKFIGKVFNFKN